MVVKSVELKENQESLKEKLKELKNHVEQEDVEKIEYI